MCYRVYVGTIKPLKIRLIRGSGTRCVAVDVPLAKLGLTKCPEAGPPSKGLKIRDESFPQQLPQDSYNQPHV